MLEPQISASDGCVFSRVLCYEILGLSDDPEVMSSNPGWVGGGVSNEQQKYLFQLFYESV